MKGLLTLFLVLSSTAIVSNARPYPDEPVVAYDPATDPVTQARQENASPEHAEDPAVKAGEQAATQRAEVAKTEDADKPDGDPPKDPQAYPEQVLCKNYEDRSHSGLDACTAFCGNIVEKKVDFASVTCDASAEKIETLTEEGTGLKYAPGVCKCDMEIMKVVGDISTTAIIETGKFVEMLISIGCQVLYKAFDVALTVATLPIPGVGEAKVASTATQMAVRAAKQVAEKGQDGVDFLDIFLGGDGPCPSYNYSLSGDHLLSSFSGASPPGLGLVKNADGSIPSGPPTRGGKGGKKGGKSGKDDSTDNNKSGDSADTNSKDSGTETKKDDNTTKDPNQTTADPSKKTTDPATSTTNGDPSSTTDPSKPTNTKACERKNNKNGKSQNTRRGLLYDEPSCEESQEIIDQLKKYDSPTVQNKLVDTIVKKYMRQAGIPKDQSIFYAGGTAESAGDQVNINYKENIASVYWGYGKELFDDKKRPMSDFKDEGTAKSKLEKNWFRATSRAFARQSQGKVYFVYDGKDWENVKGGDGQPSIFITDELPEMKAGGKVTEVIRICSAKATLWTAGTAEAIKIIESGGDLDCATSSKSKDDGEVIWSRGG